MDQKPSIKNRTAEIGRKKMVHGMDGYRCRQELWIELQQQKK